MIPLSMLAAQVAPEVNDSKFCHGCETLRLISDFAKNRRRRDGLQTQCKSCNRRRREETRPQRLEYSRKWSAANRQQLLQKAKKKYWSNPEAARRAARFRYWQNKETKKLYNKSWYAKNKEKVAIYKKKYKKRNAASIKQAKRLYYTKNRLKIIEQKRNYYLLNSAACSCRVRQRRQKIQLDFNCLADSEKIQANRIYSFARLLSSVLGREMHVDHIVPVSAGGRHHPSNLQILSASDNRTKHASVDTPMLEKAWPVPWWWKAGAEAVPLSGDQV
jgi:hypothetical protein